MLTSKMFNVFGRLFGKYLLIGNTISSAILMSIGDFIEQSNEIRAKRKHHIDWKRNLRLTICGGGMGIINHYYYRTIDRIFPKYNLNHSLKKTVADQIFASPICITFVFCCDGILLGQNARQIMNEFRTKFGLIYTADCCIWPPFQFINFRFIDNKYRVLFLNSVQMFYNILLSHLKYHPMIHLKDDMILENPNF